MNAKSRNHESQMTKKEVRVDHRSAAVYLFVQQYPYVASQAPGTSYCMYLFMGCATTQPCMGYGSRYTGKAHQVCIAAHVCTACVCVCGCVCVPHIKPSFLPVDIQHIAYSGVDSCTSNDPSNKEPNLLSLFRIFVSWAYKVPDRPLTCREAAHKKVCQIFFLIISKTLPA